ncbi:ABC transporter substrate-binding protein [Legionella taurinensis]|uniref:Solute-binding protein family 5 domain-containing protein n=1 Tax=Legionella taurinensis TaxID=70611 RepID=A0A3A5L0I5_9GAMM|nr:ABC transporter substrate-binding protein [Legionella taurinensis]RJT43306.1 hypothetical protein D6J04_14540 [Legionella taurinensis]RJT63957.1 hypothetical protein D6J03_15065 [Legionella taurinensis]
MLNAIKNSANVFLDAPPISRSIHQLKDYSSYLVYSLCSMPLVRMHPTENTILPLAVKSWEATDNYSVYEFVLRDDIYWSTGEKVKAIDYCMAINFVLSDNSNRFRSLLADIIGYSEVIKQKSNNLSGMEFENNIIRFRLNSPNYFFPMYLSLPVFSPLSTINHEIFCGAYIINKVADYEVELKRNEYFKHDLKSDIIDKITFSYKVNESDPFALEAFNQGEVDVTSDTSFPYDKYSSYVQQKAIIQEYNVDISCILSENKNTTPELTKILTYGINREYIIEKLHGVPELNCGYHHLFDRKNRSNHDYLYNKKLALELRSKIDTSAEITIAYEDFYPNLEIITLIAEQLEDIGLMFKFVVEEYGARNINSHFRLELTYPPKISP